MFCVLHWGYYGPMPWMYSVLSTQKHERWTLWFCNMFLLLTYFMTCSENDLIIWLWQWHWGVENDYDYDYTSYQINVHRCFVQGLWFCRNSLFWTKLFCTATCEQWKNLVTVTFHFIGLYNPHIKTRWNYIIRIIPYPYYGSCAPTGASLESPKKISRLGGLGRWVSKRNMKCKVDEFCL